MANETGSVLKSKKTLCSWQVICRLDGPGPKLLIMKTRWEHTKTDYITNVTTRIRRPIAFGGKFLRNFARTAPLLPCGRVIFPQITRKWLGFSWPGHAVFLHRTAIKYEHCEMSTSYNTQKSTHPTVTYATYHSNLLLPQLLYTYIVHRLSAYEEVMIKYHNNIDLFCW